MTKFGHIGVITTGVVALVGFAGAANAKPGQPILWNGVRAGMSLAE